jgi:hypothetical protein
VRPATAACTGPDGMAGLSVPPAAHPETPPTQQLLELAGCHLTTPHKLQAEARLGKPSRAGRVACPEENAMAEACQLHAVVRQQGQRSELWAPVCRTARFG